MTASDYSAAITAEGGGKKTKKMVDAHFSLLMQMDSVYGWLKNKNLKKMTNWAYELVEEKKIAASAPEAIKGKMLKNIADRMNIILDIVDVEMGHKKVFTDFVEILKIAFPGNRLVKKRVSEMVKLHSLFFADLVKAKSIVSKK
jgi:hypothetical protein